MLIRSSEAGCFDSILNLKCFSFTMCAPWFHAAFSSTSHGLMFQSKVRENPKRTLVNQKHQRSHVRHVQVCVCCFALSSSGNRTAACVRVGACASGSPSVVPGSKVSGSAVTLASVTGSALSDNNGCEIQAPLATPDPPLA